MFGSCTAGTPVGHTFLTDWSNSARTQKAQDDITAFVKVGTLPDNVVEQ